jgi:HPt (histidine-containing phosphotransfer) domain-containing protein
MSNPVDLTDLRTMTDGDKEMEIALFDEFYSSSEALIKTMELHSVDGANEYWRASAHALKGSAYNVGAKDLGDLCKEAQEHPEISGAEKKALLEKIKAEYAEVKLYLQNTHHE